MHSQELDKFDQAIITALRENARQPVSAIADQVNLSRSSVSERLKRLEKSGVIRGYQVLLRPSADTDVSAYFEIRHNQKQCKTLAEMLRRYPEVQSCHGITGEVDLLVLVRADSMQRLHQIREAVEALPAVTKIVTHVVMSEWI
ncbi:transcriptional regulator, AsnC family [Ferrimonas balearica DSM 9799]|uniref:Transcriptional regulator, AsnC family n=1 Tax=Ferrimonas balearica (strain DSM 9799 / CCM 4581 / KCTC 23876 / PAT) TaxID=550540 RepID=E1SUE7_FERBD|nr:Lrp/AsnC family transcriptional regulator [Ferrimonas balearica]MBY6017758.1 Lrp/AsnC family transcriptional regulator [Halomonas denitrificans]ADN77254.1 transcriptional regulator, AsnC family [Ferrimonas balearica DSM 9799]MBW3139752.1 Lrp/AsnC family transcriptional regulator [Ferrimonas balearica]MBY5980360.1 Lrp/AsnC family transcriptional regulator [Ferrimonas balearica]MBY6224302.1 Lrp/AsnC family transcriptional regulator [Ferrimonas balearica]